MKFIAIKFQKKEQDNRRKGQGKKHGVEERVQLRVEKSEGEKKKVEFIP